jgi:Flp pilus assembly protein TadD
MDERDPKSAEHRGGEAGASMQAPFRAVQTRTACCILLDVRDITRQFVKARRRAALFFAARQSHLLGPHGGAMRPVSAKTLFAGIVGAISVFLVCGAALSSSSRTGDAASNVQPAKIAIDYPLEGSVFPPEITPPTFFWHDPAEAAKRWVVEVGFEGQSDGIRIETAGERLQRGEIDPKAGEGIELTPEQAATRTWKPDAATWAKIKRLSVKSPATITISGFADGDSENSVSTAKVTISTAADPVGAPVFYRDVPLLLPPPGEHGPIQPLPQSAIPLIKWQMRNIAEPQSHTVMENLPTCANCHSFSRDGKTLGLDMDGPRNDKGLYALVQVSRDMTIRNQDVLRWSSFQVSSEARSFEPAVKRFGFMAQVSPDGQYVVTSIGPPKNANTHQNEVPGFAAGILDRLYSTNYRDIAFSQVFFPTRGILVWYDRKEKKMQPLPGADDPDFVQTSAFWSPDGKYLIYSRAKARDPYPPGAPKPLHANDPNETQIQYDLYKIPFNGGKGGKAVPVEGASGNGMSNDFPKVSPDGRWIVWVQNKNGLLMRPDSRLFMVPFAGGKPRLMNCNTRLMNSWHTFSPNGRWLAFSSKARGPYTQLMLTHIDANGNDTPAIIVDNTTAANRAVNIPEFVNMPLDGIDKIDPQATEFYSLFDQAFALVQNNKIPEAIQVFRSAIQLDPDDPQAHYDLGTVLSGIDRDRDALDEFRRASTLEPENTLYLEHFAVSLALNGDLDGAVTQLQKAIAFQPTSSECRFNLGFALESKGDFAAAVAPFEKAVELSGGKNARFLAELAKVYDKTGRSADAVKAARQALDLAVLQNNEQLERNLREALDGYEADSAKANSR